jgi:enoyl-CoA hydratase
MAMQYVAYDVDRTVCTITLNRPEKRNAVDGVVAAELREAFERFEADDALRVAVLAGAGGNFCAGADLSAVGDPARRNELDTEGGGSGPMADDDAVFGVFCRRWGVPLIDGGTVRLPRIVGMGRALDMILSGRPVGAPEALAMGLVNRVTPPGGALAAAQELAHQLSAFPQQCMLADRRSAYAQWDMPLAEALRREGAQGVPMVFAEGEAGAARFAGGAGRHGEFKR